MEVLFLDLKQSPRSSLFFLKFVWEEVILRTRLVYVFYFMRGVPFMVIICWVVGLLAVGFLSRTLRGERSRLALNCILIFNK